MAELGVNKRLIKNKKDLSDILQKEQVYCNEEKNNEADDGNSTDNNEEEASEEASGAEESDKRENDSENDIDESTNRDSENMTIMQSKISCERCEKSNVYKTTILQCPKCSWHDSYLICPICDYEIPLKLKKAGNRGFFSML